MSAYSALVLGDGPRAYWRFGESGIPIHDSSPSGINFTDGPYGGGTPTFAQPSLLGGDPSDLSINLPLCWLSRGSDPALDVRDVFTIEVWIALNQTVGNGLACIYTAWTGAQYLRVNASNHVELCCSGGPIVCTSTVALDLQPHHVVATKNGADVHIYIDGVDVSGPVTNFTFSNSPGWLAISQDANPEPGNAKLDELAIYPTALSAAQVLTHYQTGHSSGPPPQTVSVPSVPPSSIGTSVSITGMVICGDGHLVGSTPASQFGLVTAHAAIPAVRPAGLGSAQVFGVPRAIREAKIVPVGGVPSAQAFGTSTLIYPQWITVGGVPSAQAFGDAAGGLVVFIVWIHETDCLDADLAPIEPTTLDLQPALCQ